MAKTVLICDDEPYILESVSYVVKKEGFKVLTAENGEDALRIAEEQKPDLIFLDVEMPKKTGYEVCEVLKRNEMTRGIYVIMLTARGQVTDERKGFEMGADEYITKPFSPRKLIRRVHEILD